ncbi:cbb3-type cytochrome c oxidase subunit 3 [Aquiflexum sp. LQ15W]|jgi:cytochrome c oxidase cbb3-type subunit IV|uniref:cbb3-type cytochrome c oxidase subunit 3 n=1 Tax=Cognataquiflexum TaxID=3020066 RepID=UPI000DEA7D08|nr:MULTISPECIES: cbb3-type cytochrome c oxidase subunit 3 [Cognataquiflexum]MCH6200365.1 cbb3-type cytochrome c oxidase subunit 3 [Cognataquiflexum nitidum]
MKKDILSSIENIEIYPIISLLIFVIFFIGMFIWVISVDKKYINHMKEMPFNDEPQNIEGYEKV